MWVLIIPWMVFAYWFTFKLINKYDSAWLVLLLVFMFIVGFLGIGILHESTNTTDSGFGPDL